MLILLLALATTPAFAKSKPSAVPVSSAKKSQTLEQLHQTCLKNAFQEGKSQDAACGCLRANYEKKLNEEELQLLARIQAGTVAKDELEGKDELLEFDMEASQHCVEDSGWRWVPKPKEEKAEESADETKEAAKPAAKPAPKAKPAHKTKKATKPKS